MTDLLLYIFLGLIVNTLAVLGGHVATENRKYRRAFYVLGFLALLIIIITGVRNYQSSLKASNDFISLKNAVSEQRDNIAKLPKTLGVRPRIS
jgi:uncharacterized membrane protein